jgi:AraC-like DNA-binding protein
MQILDIVFVYHLRELDAVKWHTRVHNHGENQYELHYFISGSGSFRNGDAVYRIRRNHVHVTCPHQTHGIRPDDLSDPITYYAVLFELDPDMDRSVPGIDPERLKSVFPRAVGAQHRLYFENMKNKFVSRNQYFKASALHGLLTFLFDIFGRLEEGEPGEAGEPAMTDRGSNIYVERAMDLFQRNIEGSVKLAEVSERLRISEEHLIKLFRRKIGITPMRYYQNLKMEAAVSLLLNTSMSVKEIAWRLGFSSQYHFSRNFKLYSNASPTEYRAAYFAREASASTSRSM